MEKMILANPSRGFSQKPIMLSIAPGLVGNMDDIITKGQSSFLPQSPSPTPKALCHVSKI